MSESSVDRSRVEAVFLEALEREGPERAAFLADRCAGDPTLRAEVDSLLAALDAHGPLPDLDEAPAFGGRFPARIGAYRIVRVLGEGGMGIVLLAIREGPGFEQTVALKLIRGRFADPLLARRLEEERRILAGLEHPGIARLVDGGVTEDGQPYYAMEYVQGDDLLAWADARRLALHERIRLFEQVCDAVHYAHRRLVVHRDLKPSNILVTADGRPKLLDFGIARNLEGVASPETTAPWVTPAYASPEQLSGGVVDTRTDVYALGVLLCQLLTGAPPRTLDASSPAALVRTLESTPPRRPSDLATDDDVGGTPAAARAAARASTPGRLARGLRAELDWIVGRALAAEPERRYDSVRALADDLERFLDGRPVAARPDSLVYRWGKRVRRNRPASAAAALLVASVVLGVAGVAWQARRAAVERDRAAAEAVRARQVTALMTDIFRLGDPTQALGDTIGVRQVLEAGVRKVESSLAGDPAVQATLFLELARVYRNLGILGEARRLGARALELREAHEPESLAHADALGFLGLLLRDAGDPDGAVVRLEQAATLRERLLEDPDTALATLWSGLGWELRAAGDPERARGLFERALGVQRAALGDDAPVVGTSMLGLAATFHDEGSFDEAEALFRTALAPGRAEASPVVATALVNLGMMQRIRERYGDAEPLLRAGLEMRTRLFDPDHPEVLEAREEVAVDLATLGRYAEAESLLVRNLESGLRFLGDDHDVTRGAHEALGIVYGELARWDDAVVHLEEALASKRRVREGDHPSIVYSLVALGDVLIAAGRLDEGEARHGEALAMGLRLGGNEGVYGALSRHGLARAALVRGDVERADSLATEAARLLATLREEHRYRLDLGRTEARILLARGRPAEAEAILGPVLEAERAVRPRPHPRRGETLELLGRARSARGDAAGAAAAWREAEAEFLGLPPGHPARLRLEPARTGR